MTLGRRGREPDRPVAYESGGRQPVEIEELPGQRVEPRAPMRPRLGGLLAAGGITLIVVAGLGFLGGRESANQAEPRALQTTRSTSERAEVPAITPNIACVPIQPDVVPGAILQVGGTQSPGAIEVIDWRGPHPSAVPSSHARVPARTAPIEVRTDLTSVVSTARDVCALAWQIALVDASGSVAIEGFENPTADPRYAQQNRFTLPLFPYRGHDYELEALLTFPNAVVRATWPIRILPFDLPVARLTAGTRSIAIAPGCDVQVSLGGGEQARLVPCDGSVATTPAATRVATGAPLTFSFSAGWGAALGGIACGQLSGAQFMTEPDCEIPFDITDGSASFDAAPVPGTWMVGISGCATQDLPDVYNEVCGTWYATVRVRN